MQAARLGNFKIVGFAGLIAAENAVRTPSPSKSGRSASPSPSPKPKNVITVWMTRTSVDGTATQTKTLPATDNASNHSIIQNSTVLSNT